MIEVTDLHKSFGAKKAVDGVSFTVKTGEVLGFLGPNGAGKSTTMRMITGYLPITSGEVLVDGKSIEQSPEDVKRLIGYLPESAPLYTDMSVSAFLGFCAELRGLRGTARRQAVDRVIELCFLGKVRHQSIDTLSKGYRHRTCLAQSLLHDPQILILDEPTDGLDPNQKHEIRTLIREMGKEKAIIFSTHILEEVEAACTRALIIHQGKIIADGTPASLARRAPGSGKVRVIARGLAGTGIAAEIGKLDACSGVEAIESGSDFLVGLAAPKKKTSTPDLAAAIHQLAAAKGWRIESIHEEVPRLDEVFRKLTTGEEDAA